MLLGGSQEHPENYIEFIDKVDTVYIDDSTVYEAKRYVYYYCNLKK